MELKRVSVHTVNIIKKVINIILNDPVTGAFYRGISNGKYSRNYMGMAKCFVRKRQAGMKIICVVIPSENMSHSQ